MMSPQLELTGSINYDDYGDDGQTSFGAGIWYTITGNIAVGGTAEFGDDISTYGVGFRLYFDK